MSVYSQYQKASRECIVGGYLSGAAVVFANYQWGPVAAGGLFAAVVAMSAKRLRALAQIRCSHCGKHLLFMVEREFLRISIGGGGRTECSRCGMSLMAETLPEDARAGWGPPPRTDWLARYRRWRPPPGEAESDSASGEERSRENGPVKEPFEK